MKMLRGFGKTRACARAIFGTVLAAGVLFSCVGCTTRHELRVATYNVENLFDAVYDGSEYASFDPRSDDWGENRYRRSLENTVRVIEQLGEGEGADILALQEIENQQVLEDLAGALARLGYSHRVLVENTGAFHNAVFSRVPVDVVRTHALSLPWSGPGRYILEVDIHWDDLMVRVLVNHWHSKSGGAEETERSRRQAAAIVTRRIRDSVSDNGPPVIVLGDLNANADEYARVDGEYPTALLPLQRLGAYDPARALYLSDKPQEARVCDTGVVVYSPWTAGAMPGSYVYRGQWNSFDHILLGPGFRHAPAEAKIAGIAVDHDGHLSEGGHCPDGRVSGALDAPDAGILVGEFSVLMEPFMLDSRGLPERWRRDSATGYSDHLPVEMVLYRR